MNDEPHPWGVFLDARWRAMIWMREEMGYSDTYIANSMSMDETQVYLILSRPYTSVVQKNRVNANE